MTERRLPPRIPQDDSSQDHESDFARILAYVSGEGTPAELQTLRAWIEAEPARRALAEELRTYREVRAATPVWNTEGALHVSLDAVRRSGGTTLRRRPAHPARPGSRSGRTRVSGFFPGVTEPLRWRFASGLAAAAAFLVLGSALVWRLETRSEPSRSAAVAATDSVAFREFATARAQRAEIRLSDGTTVFLAPASRLRVPRAYSGATREVALDGEAYFTVRHDSAHPFRVHTARSVTEDLGTKFSIRAYAGDSTVRVVVAEGKVALRAARELGVAAGRRPSSGSPPSRNTGSVAAIAGTELTARQVAVLWPSGRTNVRTVRDVDAYLAWTEGRLVFRNAPLRDVVVELGRWYALDIRLADPSLGARRLTSSFGDEPVSEVLHSLEVTLDLRATRTGDVVRLSAVSRGMAR
jgi:transmembrane sensor